MDLLVAVLEVAFLAVLAAAAARYWRERTTLNRDVVLVFATVAGLVTIAVARQLLPWLPAWLSPLAVVLLLAHPVAILSLTGHFGTLPRPFMLAALAWFVAAAGLYLMVGLTTPLTSVVAAAYFVVVEFTAGALLVLEARKRVGNARIRLALAGLATVLFGVAILVLAAGLGGAPGGDELTVNTARFLALLVGIAYLAVLVPPRWLRSIPQRATAFDLTRELVDAPTGTASSTIWERLADTTLQVTGGPAALVVLGTTHPRVEAVVGSWVDPPELGQELSLAGPDRTATTSSDDGGGFERPIPWLPALVERAGAARAIAVPLASDVEQVGWLVAFVAGEILFVEDDRELLALLGAQAVRAVEREQAIRERAALVGQLRTASDELEESRGRLGAETRFRVALEAHPSPLLVADHEGRILYANGQAATTFGYAREEFAALTLDDLVPGRAAPPAVGIPWAGRFVEARTRDGRPFPAQVATRSFDYDGQEMVIAVVEDVRERIAVDQLREKFIGVLSHELRTPVTAIYGGAQLLLSRWGRMPAETEREVVADIAGEAERLHRLIENTLVLARIEGGRELAGGDPVLIQRLLPQVVDRERSLWPGAEIRLSIPPALPTVRGDDEYVGQVVRNLISNAVKYANGRGPIEVRASVAADGVEVIVLDRGPGIDEQAVDRLFELYYRAPGVSSGVPGAGIGLFVCRQIVASLGGRMWARPRDGGGSEFGFSLPFFEADEDLVPVDAVLGEREATAAHEPVP